MKRAKFSKPRDTGESHGILKYVRRSIATVDEDTTGNNSLEYAYIVIGLFLIAPIAAKKPPELPCDDCLIIVRYNQLVVIQSIRGRLHQNETSSYTTQYNTILLYKPAVNKCPLLQPAPYNVPVITQAYNYAYTFTNH